MKFDSLNLNNGKLKNIFRSSVKRKMQWPKQAKHNFYGVYINGSKNIVAAGLREDCKPQKKLKSTRKKKEEKNDAKIYRNCEEN